MSASIQPFQRIVQLCPGFITTICYALATLAIAGLMGFAFFLQYARVWSPALCNGATYCLCVAGVEFSAWLILNPKIVGQAVQGVSALLFSGGAGLAARQVWIQHLPPDQGTRMRLWPGLLLDAFPLKDVIIDDHRYR